jgi:hypothetical protein
MDGMANQMVEIAAARSPLWHRLRPVPPMPVAPVSPTWGNVTQGD